MAEDIDDFGDFTSAFSSSSGVNDANSIQTTTESAVTTSDKVDFFASFPPTLSTSGDPSLDFASFDAFTSHTTGGSIDEGGTHNFNQFDIANVNLAELEIPSPTNPNVHFAGGVAFDIPPILDNDFSDPSSPTGLPNSVDFQNDSFSSNNKLTKSKNSCEENGNPTDVHLSFPATVLQQSGHQLQEDEGNADDNNFGEFESSLSNLTHTNTKIFMESPTVGDNLGILPDNSSPVVSTAESSAQETTNAGQRQNVEDEVKPDDDFGEFTTLQQSTGIDQTESSTLANFGDSADVVAGFTSFESTANVKIETEKSDSNGGLMFEESKTVPISSQVGDSFANFDHFQSSEPTKDDNQFGDFGAFSGSGITNTQEDEFGSFGTLQTQTVSVATPPTAVTAQEHPQADDFGAFADSSSKDDFGNFSTSGSTFGDFASIDIAPVPKSSENNANLKVSMYSYFIKK